MRMRLTVIALFLALCVAPVAAQRHGGGGGHGGFGGSRGGSMGGHAGFSGPRFSGHAGFGGARFSGHGGFSGAHFSGSHFHGGAQFFGGHRHYYGHGHYPSYYYPRYGWGFGVYWNSYPYYYGAYTYPYYSYPYGQTYYVDRSSDYQNDDRVSRQLDDLSYEVRQLKDQNQQLQSDIQRQRNPEPPQEPSMRARPGGLVERTPAEPPVALIFTDGRRIDTRSYAVTGETLWILSSDRAQKVSLAELDLEKTKRVNAGRGIDFQIPSQNP